MAVIVMSAAAAANAADEWRTEPPITYVLDYGRDHLGHPEYIEAVAGSPPTLLHLGKDVVMSHNWGPIECLGGENQAGGKGECVRRLTPEETQERLEGLTEMARQLHEAGCQMVLPYICSMTIGGSHRTRAGFWDFYDHWDDYLRFGLPPRPELDPADWMARNPDGSMGSTYGVRPDQDDFYPPYEPNMRYRACCNNPGWRTWLDEVARQVAMVGYDGAFIDNGTTQSCYCKWCQDKYQGFLRDRYTAAQMRELFGVGEGERVPLTEKPGRDEPMTPGWIETQRFWVETIHQHQLAIRRAGEQVGGRFVLFPNGGRPNYIHWALCDSDYVMFELSTGDYGTHPGLVNSKIVGDIYLKVYNDHAFEYKYTQSVKKLVKTLILTRAGYPRSLPSLELNPDTAALGMAEAAAFGSGAGFLLRPSWTEFHDVLNQYRGFFQAHAAEYTGLVPYAQVAVAAFADQALYGNSTHLDVVRTLTDDLLEGHALVDYITEDHFTPEGLAGYRVVILPDVVYASPEQLAALAAYVSAGGTALVTGATPQADPQLRPLGGALPQALAGALGGDAPTEAADGAGKWVYRPTAPDEDLVGELSRLAGTELSVAPDATRGVRMNAFARPEGGGIMLHVLNYDVPLGTDPQPWTDKTNVQIELPLPDGRVATTVTAWDPDVEGAQEIPVRCADGRAFFTLPSLHIYKMLRVDMG
ncbi:MAG TPA: beta-galactosidase trimerization domain-containing protein [Armatimonadota bacterium]|nr:beta-galactosidase trimerization domain-containing protein [Armatimonadota bacterium]